MKAFGEIVDVLAPNEHSPFYSAPGDLGELYRRIGSAVLTVGSRELQLFPNAMSPKQLTGYGRIERTGTAPGSIGPESPGFYAFPYVALGTPLAPQSHPCLVVGTSSLGDTLYWCSGIALQSGVDVLVVDDGSEFARFGSLGAALLFVLGPQKGHGSIPIPTGAGCIPAGLSLRHASWQEALHDLLSVDRHEDRLSAYTSLVNLLDTDERRECALKLLVQAEVGRGRLGEALGAWVMSHPQPALAWRRVSGTEFRVEPAHIVDLSGGS